MTCVIYPRLVVDTSYGSSASVAAGDVVFVERRVPSSKRQFESERSGSKHARVFTIEQINEKWATADGHEKFSLDGIVEQFSLDGIVKNIEDGVAGTVVMGPCSFSVTAEEARHVKVGDVLHVGLILTERDHVDTEEDDFKVELVRFFDLKSLVKQQLKKMRVVGKVTEVHDDQKVTIDVDIDPLADQMRYLNV